MTEKQDQLGNVDTVLFFLSIIYWFKYMIYMYQTKSLPFLDCYVWESGTVIEFIQYETNTFIYYGVNRRKFFNVKRNNCLIKTKTMKF